MHGRPVVGNVLVGNTGQGGRGTRSLSGGYLTLAQQFTTGGHATGYALTGVSAVLGAGRTLTAEELSKVRAQLWSNSGLDPGEKLADLAVPPPAAAAVRAFATHLAAPPGTRLAANTRYQLVFYAVGGQDQLALDVTSSGNEDAGSASGWSIANRYVGWSGEAAAGTPTVAVTSAVVQAVGAPVASDASLAGLAAVAAACADCPYEALALSPAFDSATTAYTAAVGYPLSHVRLRPTAGDASAVVRVGRETSLAPVRSGAEGATVALDEGANELVAEVTAGDGSATTTYTVTVTRTWELPAPRGSRGHRGRRGAVAALEPGCPRVDGYDVHYTGDRTVVLPDDGPSTGPDPKWIDVGYGGTATAYRLTGLNNGYETYRMRVRARRGDLTGSWAVVAGTPQEDSGINNVLVSNLGQTSQTPYVRCPGATTWVAQGFTTGDHAGGYVLSGVSALVEQDGGGADGGGGGGGPRGAVDHDGRASPCPGSRVLSLEVPFEHPGREHGPFRFRAPGGGVTLPPNTRYALVVTDGGAGKLRWWRASQWGRGHRGRQRLERQTTRRAIAGADGSYTARDHHFRRSSPCTAAPSLATCWSATPARAAAARAPSPGKPAPRCRRSPAATTRRVTPSPACGRCWTRSGS